MVPLIVDTDPGVAFFKTFVDRFGLGYAVRTEREVELPAYTGPLELPSAVGRATA